ncbi:MAG: hypothetical protein JW947_00410 [Sedimentisphaerales bacterium]|nr:hypothetical protein [Sedimentisphaerales bacterium]
MKPENDIPKLIKKLHIDSSAELDRRVHNDISEAAVSGPTMWRILTKGGVMKLAVAAAIIIAFGAGFFTGQRSKPTLPMIYSDDVTAPAPMVSAYQSVLKGEDGFWRQKVAAAMQPRPYTQSTNDMLNTYKQYLKEKHYD